MGKVKLISSAWDAMTTTASHASLALLCRRMPWILRFGYQTILGARHVCTTQGELHRHSELVFGIRVGTFHERLRL